MAAIPFALSIHHFISSVGADAGFASIIGLALLVLLFFTQARETANLRRRADYAEAQLEALHAYMDQLSRAPAPATSVAPVAAPPAAARLGSSPTPMPARAVAAPLPSRAVAPAPEPVPVGAVATIPSAPAGVGAPALSAATRLIPVGDDDPISIRALNTAGNGQAANGALADRAGGDPVPVAPPPAGPPPSTAAGAGNGTSSAPPAAAPPTFLEGDPANGAPAAAPRVSLRPQGSPPSRSAPPPLGRTAAAPRRRLNPLALALLVALVLAVIVVGVLVLTSSSGNGSSSSSSSSSSARTTAASRSASRGKHRTTTTPATAVTPASVMVAVLNGTTTPNLAHDVLAKLTTAGYKSGPTPADAAESGLSSTIVGYTQSAYRNDAAAVAKSLSLGPASVQGVSQGDRAKVCGAAATCPAQVVVTAGSDLASTG